MSTTSIRDAVPSLPHPDPPRPVVELVASATETTAGRPAADPRETAALLLIRELDRVVGDFAQECAYLHARIPLWALIVGAIQRCYEDATLVAPVLPPDVRRQTDGYIPPGQAGDSRCEICGSVFQPRRFRQRTCGSETCGFELSKRDIARHALRQNVTLAAAPDGPVVRGSGLRDEAVTAALPQGIPAV